MTKFLIALTFFCTTACASEQVMVTKDSAWARATPPGVTTTAIYLTLMNHGMSEINLISVASELSDRLELHTHLSQDGMMKMVQVDSIAIAAHSTTELKPHNYHIMVFNLKDELNEGDVVDLIVNFDDGTDLSISVPVLKVGPDTDEQKHTNHRNHKKQGKHGEDHKEHQTN